MSFLSGRTPRERALIIGALVLMGVFLLWQVGVKSVLNAHAEAERRHAAAERDLGIVQAGLPQIAAAPTNSSRASFDRSAVINTARESNIAISRVQPGSDGALQIWFDESPTTAVYYFLSRLSAGYNVDIARVQMTRRDTGTITAQVTLRPSI